MYVIRKSVGSRLFVVANILVILMVNVAMLYPFVYTVSVSFSTKSALLAGDVKLLPIGFHLESYKLVLSNPNLLRSYLNTVFYSGFGTLLVLIVTSMTAYPLSVPTYVFKNTIIRMLVITMYFGGGLVPFYLLIRSLGMIDTVWALVLPGALSVWNTIIFRTFFKEIPHSLRESALIEGANDIAILVRIVLPLSKPVIATIALFSLVGRWNDFFTPFIFLNSNEKYPLAVILRKVLVLGGDHAQVWVMNLQGQEMRYSNQSVQAATIIVAIVPIVIVYPFLQRYFVKGVMIGSLKG